jgi:uncharacterized phage protein gp47/JayE
MFGSKTFTQMLQDWAAAVQGACATLLDFAIGSILRAIAEAQGGVGLWLESLILQLLVTTRLSSAVTAAGPNNSVGPAVDSFVGDFGLTRLPAVSATGQVTFARFTPTNAATIPVGTLIQTADGTQTFAVAADTTQSAYNAALNAYVIPANTSSITATVQCTVGGTGGNISAGTLTVLQTGISGVDTVTNGSAFTNGVNAETNGALATRFIAFINSLSKATLGAFGYAILSLQQGLQYQLIENKTYGGVSVNGLVTVIIDDGSGDTPSGTISAVANALNAVRAAGIQVAVYAATELTANVVVTIGVAPGYLAANVQAAVLTALTSGINGVGLANPFDYMMIGSICFAVPGVATVTAATLNGGTADLVPTQLQTIKVGTLTVNIAS